MIVQIRNHEGIGIITLKKRDPKEDKMARQNDSLLEIEDGL